MKTLKQIHEDEQRAARIAEVHAVFIAAMHQIEADHQDFMRRQARQERLFRRVFFIALALALALPLLAYLLNL